MAPRWVRQIQLLLWKNFILQIRRPIGTAFEIIVPVAFSALLLIARFNIKSDTSDRCFMTFDPEQGNYPFYNPFTVYPNTSWAQSIINSSTAFRKYLIPHDRFGNPFTSEEAAAAEAANYPDEYSGAIIFENVNSNELPKKISYKIRTKKWDAAPTNRIYPQFQSPGAEAYSSYSYMFVPLQKALDKAIIELQTQQKNLLSVDKLTQFPYPSYKVDDFIQLIQNILPIIFVVAFIYTAVCIIREIVREKKEGLKEAMKMMGLSNWVHWFSWFAKNFIFLAISCVMLTILLKVGKIFAYTDGTLLFVFFLSYCVSVIFFCFAISAFSCNVICGMLVGAILWILSYVPYVVLTAGTKSRYDIMTTTQKAAACLLPNTCLGIGIQVISKFEVSQIGGQWSNIATTPSIDENFNLLMVIVMFFAQSLMWWIIAWYVESVFPGEFGVPKPFYFFLTCSYWFGSQNCFGKSHKCSDIEEIAMEDSPGNVNSDVEPAPEGSEVGVDIRGLRKVFKGSTGKKVAIDGLNLKMYKGQITALLGHNGAGKTTTISILTGLFTPTKGTATVNGRDIRKDMDEIRDSLGLCPQHNVLFDRLTVQEHLEFFIALKGVSNKQAKPKIDEMLKDVQLEDKRFAKAFTLSGGMKRKLCCAIALIGDPDIVFLDEPTSGMDPYARRATWDLLEKYANHTTIILTTHFMDEADYLGDRIAIMTNGQLRCCGSSLYLKKKYGIGYRMTLVKNPEVFKNHEISKLIERTIPTAKMDSDTSTEQSYVLDHKTSRKFRDLFEKLEEQKDELGVLSFGVSITTLEEVFLKVGEETAAPDEKVEFSNDDEFEISKEKDKLTGIPLKLSQFRAMFTKRFINSKREKKAVFTQLILPLVVIIAGLALSKVTAMVEDMPPLGLDLKMLSEPEKNTFAFIADYRGNDTADWTKWTKHMRTYFGGVRVSQIDVSSKTLKIQQMNKGNLVTFKGKRYNLTKDGMRSCCNYGNLVLNRKCQQTIKTRADFTTLCGANDKTFGYAACPQCIDASRYEYQCPMSVKATDSQDPYTFYNEYILEQSNSKRFFNKYVAGITFKNDTSWKRTGPFKVDGWYSNEALHTLPSVVSAIDNIILKYLKDDDSYGITTINHPLPMNSKEREQASASDPTQIVMSIFGTMTAAFISASFVVFIISEKKSKAKHIQFISGVNGMIYWSATFCWDFINYLVPAVLIMISFAAFKDSFVKGNDLGALCFVILLYGLSVLPFTYLLSYIFKSPFVAYAVISLLGFLVSVAMFFAVFICRMSQSSCSSAAPIMHNIFLLIPMYGFSSSILDVSQNKINRERCTKPANRPICEKAGTKWHENVLAFEYPGVGMTCLYFIVECFVYLTLVILIEENFFIKFKPKPPPQRPDNPGQDDDVKNEKYRVANMQREHMASAAVVIRDLTKVYRSNNITAVDAVSAIIPKGQCFGLLGVNGAGKTTTFSMLTGELGITAGTAYLDGFNIQQDLREVQKRIGYCPQFDALLDRLTGREMLEMFARLRGIPSKKIPYVVNAVLYRLNLNKYADKMCGKYSGGNKRKLSTALAIVGDPPVLFLDEPTSGMDPVSRRFLWNTLTSILQRNDRSIILTSHNMEECEALCNKLVIMVNGEFKCIGGLQHIKSRFGHGFTLSIKVGEKGAQETDGSFRKRRSSSRGDSRVSRPSVRSDDASIIENECLSEAFEDEGQSVIQQYTEKVKIFVENYFPGSYLLELRPGMLQYQVLNAQLKWSYMFGTLEDNAANMHITDYSLSQTTLEQVFNNFARFQREEIKRPKICCCCTG